MGLHSSPTEGCPGAYTTRASPHMSCHLLFYDFKDRVGLHSSTTKGCPGVYTTRGLHICLVTFLINIYIYLYSRVGWASTAPLLKAVQGPPHMFCHLLIYNLFILVFYGRVGLHSSTTEGCPGASTYVLSPFNL